MPRSRRRRRGRRTPAEIRALLARLETSGLSQAAFAESVDVPLSTLASWKRRFRGSAVAHEPAELVPVRLAAGTEAPAFGGHGGDAFEVALRSGHVIRVPTDFCRASLERLIGVLGGS
jgi:hypothetical protein